MGLAHSLDPALIPRVLETSSTLTDSGPLSASERELVTVLTTRVERRRDPTATWSDARQRMIAELTTAVAEAPWTLSRDHLSRAYTANLSDEDVLHVVALSAYCGHTSRIADVVGETTPPDPSMPPLAPAPKVVTARAAIDLSRRPATAAALAEWRSYIFYRDAPLTRRQRTLLARWVAAWLGDGGISPPTDLTVNPHDDALRAFAEVVTLAPWQLSDASFAPLRDAGFDDAAIYDAAATVTSAGVFSRIEVALAALAR